jgi:hypothetical protein
MYMIGTLLMGYVPLPLAAKALMARDKGCEESTTKRLSFLLSGTNYGYYGTMRQCKVSLIYGVH